VLISVLYIQIISVKVEAFTLFTLPAKPAFAG